MVHTALYGPAAQAFHRPATRLSTTTPHTAAAAGSGAERAACNVNVTDNFYDETCITGQLINLALLKKNKSL